MLLVSKNKTLATAQIQYHFEIKVKVIISITTLHFIVVDRKNLCCKHYHYISVNDTTGPLISDKNLQDSFNAEDDVPYYPDCQCYDDDRGLDCSDDNYRSPPSLLTVTQDIMQNITGQSESDYIYYTTDIYRLSRWVGNKRHSDVQISIVIRVFHSLYKVGTDGNFVFKGFNNSKKSYLQWGST